MKKQSFFKGTLILLYIGIIVKILGFFNRIIVARFIGSDGIAIYSLAVPTLILGITISQLGFPLVISKLVAQNQHSQKTSNRKIVITALIIGLLVSVTVTTLSIILAPLLANNLLHDKKATYAIIGFALSFPLISVSGVLKGYLQGMRYMSTTAYSQLAEQLVRFLSSYLLVYFLAPYGLAAQVFGATISVAIAEIGAITYILYRLKRDKKNFSLPKLTDVPKFKLQFISQSKDILDVALPTTGSRLIGSLIFFFEPIIFATSVSLVTNSTFDSSQVFGEITGLVIPLLLTPSFISVTLSMTSIPIISEAYSQKNYAKIRYYTKMTFLFAFIPGLFTVVVFAKNSSELMELIYGSKDGYRFLQILAPFFILHYFQHPMTSILQAIGHAKQAMYVTLVSGIIKLGLVFLLVQIPEISYYGLAIATIFNIAFVTTFHYYDISKIIKLKFSIKPFINAGLLAIVLLCLSDIVDYFTPNLFIVFKVLILFALYSLILMVTNYGDIKNQIKQFTLKLVVKKNNAKIL